MTDLMTPLVRRLGLEVPIIRAPMGSAAAPELVGAVTEAGGLGLLALTWLTDRQAQRHIQRVRQLTDRPFGANLVLDFPVASRLAVCLDEGVPVISTFWGDPAGVHRQIRAEGRLHMHTVGSVEEALRAADAGVDVIVAQGWEAGGHVLGECSACRGGCHPRPGSGEQRGSQLALQLLDLLGQRRLGHEQPLRRAGEIPFFGDGGEGTQQPGVDVHALRLWIRVLDVHLDPSEA